MPDLLRAKEGVVLGRVHLVEGLMGDVRAAGDLGDRQPGESLRRDDRRGRVDDPFALAFDDELARQVMAAAGQAADRAARALGRERQRGIAGVAAAAACAAWSPAGRSSG